MARYHGEIARMVDAAEMICPIIPKTDDQFSINAEYKCCQECPFRRFIYEDKDGRVSECALTDLRGWIGDHVQQHDVMPAVPPCQCAGDCGCRGGRE